MIKLENGKARCQALLNSGFSRSIISTTFMQALQTQEAKLETSAVAFELVKGSTQSKDVMEVRFRIPQLKRNSVIVAKWFRENCRSRGSSCTRRPNCRLTEGVLRSSVKCVDPHLVYPSEGWIALRVTRKTRLG
ncbi:hypothetical protein PR001_g4630 [Phytophthora rubi]|uniref:Uncharacterized protein n=1 Tax=Phytophthora rubi TaxID=129364 RepID=A0A6A3NUD0_9STRA|nr:hypothetical protein PR001_g4630 [Phytophthora rubi]